MYLHTGHFDVLMVKCQANLFPICVVFMKFNLYLFIIFNKNVKEVYIFSNQNMFTVKCLANEFYEICAVFMKMTHVKFYLYLIKM